MNAKDTFKSVISQANCRNEDPELFFPTGPTRQRETMARKAKEICKGCSIREECLEYALIENEHYGILGGMDETERYALKRKRSRRKPPARSQPKTLVGSN